MIGNQGIWTPQTARKEARVVLGRIANVESPADERLPDHKAITESELSDGYTADWQARLLLGKGGRPKRAYTIVTDTGRIRRHIIPLVGMRRVEDPTLAAANPLLKDIMAGKAAVKVETKKASQPGDPARCGPHCPEAYRECPNPDGAIGRYDRGCEQNIIISTLYEFGMVAAKMLAPGRQARSELKRNFAMTQFFTKLPAATAALFASLVLLYGALAPVDANVGYLEIAAITATELA